jgi:glucose dehydrogenase
MPTFLARRGAAAVAAALFVAGSVAAYASQQQQEPPKKKNPKDYPLTQEGKPLASLSNAKGTAPDVCSRVTSERLLNARTTEPQNWLTYYGAYDGQRYSTLDQINTENVKNLRPAWTFQYGNIGLVATPATYSFEAAPIVVDGVMYVSGWEGYVWALDATNGQLLWQYQHQIPLDTPLCCGNVNRGVAVAKGKVIVATANGHLVALDGTNGKPVWSLANCLGGRALRRKRDDGPANCQEPRHRRQLRRRVRGSRAHRRL